MWLAIDAGNSHVVFGLFREKTLLHLMRVPTGQLIAELRSPEGNGALERILDEHLRGDLNLSGKSAITVASVVPLFTQYLKNHYPHAQIIDSSWPFSIQIATEVPSKTGIDRLVNAEAAAREGILPAILIDSGTTTTVCALTAEKVFLGGAILPGIEACRDSVAARGAQLFAIDLSAPERTIGRNTTEALKSGIVLGYLAMVEGMIERFRQEMLPEQPQILATGGAWNLVRGLSSEEIPYDPHLTLRGIAYLHHQKQLSEKPEKLEKKYEP